MDRQQNKVWCIVHNSETGLWLTKCPGDMGVCISTGTATPRRSPKPLLSSFLATHIFFSNYYYLQSVRFELHTWIGVLLVNYGFLLSLIWRYSGLIWMQPLLKWYDLMVFKGARSRNFRQFQHWSGGHRINWNNKVTAQNYRRTQTKHRKAKN